MILSRFVPLSVSLTSKASLFQGNTVQAQFMAPRSCADECYNRTQPPYSMNCTDCGKLTDVFADAMDVQSFSYKCRSKHHLPSSYSQRSGLTS